MFESTAAPTSVFNQQNPQNTLLSVNIAGVTKLTQTNYLMWRRQVRALLEGHKLHQFIDGSLDIPAPTVVVADVSSPNPEFAPWRRQDRLLYNSIIGAITLPIQSVISTASTTKEVWDTLADTFGNPSRGHIRQLKFQIKTCSKGTKTISEYLRLIKSKADELALLGKPLDPEDLIEQILAGLTDDYKPEIDAINGRDTPISYLELHEKLLNREAMLLCSDAPSSVAPIVANATDTRSRQQPHSFGNLQYRPNNHNNKRFVSNNSGG